MFPISSGFGKEASDRPGLVAPPLTAIKHFHCRRSLSFQGTVSRRFLVMRGVRVLPGVHRPWYANKKVLAATGKSFRQKSACGQSLRQIPEFCNDVAATLKLAHLGTLKRLPSDAAASRTNAGSRNTSKTSIVGARFARVHGGCHVPPFTPY